jgi:hypothetical protein
MDEDYFFTALVPIAASLGRTGVARDALEDLSESLGRPQGVRLQRTLSPVPSDLDVKEADALLGTLDQSRVNRVLWKIVRGLAYGLSLHYLPEANEHSVALSAHAPEADHRLKVLRSFPGDSVNAFCFDHSIEADRSVWHLAFWTQLLSVVRYPKHGGPVQE